MASFRIDLKITVNGEREREDRVIKTPLYSVGTKQIIYQISSLPII